MKSRILITAAVLLSVLLSSCADKVTKLALKDIELVRRQSVGSDAAQPYTLSLNAQKSDGMAMLKKVCFETGTVSLAIKGENIPGKSFVGLAFNIQNDSTYEAIYFRPFNFKAKELKRREHSVQYISLPENDWRYLRTKYKGEFEAEFPDAPAPNDWFNVSIKIDSDMVYVYDKRTNAELLSVKRKAPQVSDKIGLWAGFNSKGDFKDLRITK